jgi:hypothetical protein
MGWKQPAENAIQATLDCRPCSIYGQKPCRRGDYACLNMIKPETIVARIEQILDASDRKNDKSLTDNVRQNKTSTN